MIGTVIGRLTVLADAGMAPGYRRMYQCRCECGSVTTVMRQNLVGGSTRSCGCLHSDVTTAHSTRHGGSKSSTYQSWAHMRQRCLNSKHPRFSDYGGRGITIDPRWDDFAAFVQDMGERPEGLTLERSNNEKGYSADNCVWATKAAQARNRRPRRGTHVVRKHSVDVADTHAAPP